MLWASHFTVSIVVSKFSRSVTRHPTVLLFAILPDDSSHEYQQLLADTQSAVAKQNKSSVFVAGGCVCVCVCGFVCVCMCVFVRMFIF